MHKKGEIYVPALSVEQEYVEMTQLQTLQLWWQSVYSVSINAWVIAAVAFNLYLLIKMMTSAVFGL